MVVRTDSNEKPLYNSRIINTYIKLIKKKYSYLDVDELLSYAGMEPYQVVDEGHWFTQTQSNRFHKRLKELTGNKNIAREAGLYSASPEILGGIKQYILGLVSPASAYALVGKFTNKFIRSSIYESKKIGPNKVEIIVTPNEGVEEESFQCENRQGYIEAVSRIFNYKFPEIEHPECLFKGDKVCRYIVSWQKSPVVVWKKNRDLFAILSIISCVLTSFFISPHFVVTVIIPVSFSIILLLSWHVRVLENKELSAAVNHLKNSSDELLEQINMNYESALMINEIGQALSKESDIDGTLTRISQVLKKRLDYDRGLVLLSSPDGKRLVPKAGYGYTAKQFRVLREIDFHLDRPGSKGMFVVSYRKQKPVLLNDIDEVKDDLSPRSLDFAKKMGVKSFLCCPIVFENESMGVLAVDNIKSKSPLVQRDMNLLMGVAQQIGISIYNARLVEARIRQFKSILQVLVASTDARDPITAGHSEMVTRYAVGICRELGLAKDYCEMIRVASLLHDYGKIGVDDAILKKPGRLTSDEYEEIKTHVQKTRVILEQVNFEGVYREVPIIAAAHHEKLDGSGYPAGLTDDDIPFGAKIIAVADVFEAITSKRHYRDPMSIDTAFELLRRDVGTHFDGECVEALSSYYHKIKSEEPETAFIVNPVYQ